MRTPDYDDVFVVGDCALIMNPEAGRPYPPAAQMALQMSDVVAHNVKAMIEGSTELETIEPKMLGTVAFLGNTDAIVTIMNDCKMYVWSATVMKKVIVIRLLL